jgi:TnpA family transposase
MPSLKETAYPRLNHNVSTKELITIYTPTSSEVELAERLARGRVPQLGFLILLKTFQRLGHAMPLAEVPIRITQHIANSVHRVVSLAELKQYDASVTRKRQLTLVRKHLQIKRYDRSAQPIIETVMEKVAQAKHDLLDLINAAIEELARYRYELPAFSTLERFARRIRNTVTEKFYDRVASAFGREEQMQLERLWIVDVASSFTLWNQVKQDPGKPTLTQLQKWIERSQWLSQLRCGVATLEALPEAKLRHFAQEAQTLDAAQMKELPTNKRYTLAAALLHTQYACCLDDLVEIFLKCWKKMDHKAKARLEEYRAAHQAETDTLVLTLRDILVAHLSEGDEEYRLDAIKQAIGDSPQQTLQQCEAHLAYVGNNHFSFLQPYYRVYRATLFRLLSVLSPQSSTQNQSFAKVISFIQAHQMERGEWITLSTVTNSDTSQASEKLDLDWIPNKWWLLITGQKSRDAYPTKLNRRYFEMCVFSQIWLELRSGDLYVEGSIEFGDYSRQLISWEEYEMNVSEYGQMLNLPTEGKAFTAHVRKWLTEVSQLTDVAFPGNTEVDYKKNKLVIRKPQKKQPPKGLAKLEALIAQRFKPISILDALTDTERWLNWSRSFKPISGYETKLDDPVAHYIATTFCYGCNIGPSQLARSIGDLDRKQMARTFDKHTDEDKIQAAIDVINNGYNRFLLPKHWGSGKHASVDGSKWDVYENNLLSEYHIRYGGYGGIGYYHISDTYIALFSHFIPCGVLEAIHIIDALLKNQSDIQPDTIHGDSHSQSTTVFALAYLLGIKLMPRIRNWQQMNLYRPSHSTRYDNIDFLFSETVDWDLIETHLPDMLRVVLSIKAGKITAATLLRKLGSFSRKNKLFQAFDQLGRAVRTGFLLQYINDPEMRQMIQEAINKTESFHAFSQWVDFGGVGEIRTNNREQQRRHIKFNHLVANSLIFYNVVEMSRILNELIHEGYPVEAEAVAALSPYLRQYNRFGRYDLNMNRIPAELDYDIPIVSPLSSTILEYPKNEP